jgi:hypothetical protein
MSIDNIKVLEDCAKELEDILVQLTTMRNKLWEAEWLAISDDILNSSKNIVSVMETFNYKILKEKYLKDRAAE